MKLTDLINGLATKAGKQNEQTIIDLLSRADLTNIDIADDVANSINNGLLTIDSAKNNVAIKNHFTALALSPIDELILNNAKNFGFDDDFVGELAGNKNTFDKQRKLSDKIRETIESLKAAQGKGDKTEIEKYTKQINDLKAKISEMTETHVSKTELEKVKKDSENAVLDFMLQSKLTGLNYANKELAAETSAKLARLILNEALEKSDAILVKDGNAIKLKQSKEPTLDYYDQTNKAVSIDDFMNKTFADAKILSVSNGGNPPVQQPFVPPAVTQGQSQPGLAEFQAEVQNQINSLN